MTSGDVNTVSVLLATGADVNESNDGGQTALILAVIFGHTRLVRLLMEAGADPQLRDNLGLNAIEWAQRRGLLEAVEILTSSSQSNTTPARAPGDPKDPGKISSTPVAQPPTPDDETRKLVSADEKSRRWIAGLKQRFDEQARREAPDERDAVPREPATTEDLSPALERRDASLTELVNPAEPTVAAPPLESTAHAGTEISPPNDQVISEAIANEARLVKAPAELPSANAFRTSSSRKRCPKCNAIYNSELLAYCAHHIVPLVDADEPVVPVPTNTTTTPLLWVFVLVTVSLAVFTGYLITSYLTRVVPQTAPTSTPPQQTNSTQKGLPGLGGELVGKAISLPEAEYQLTGSEPVFGTVIVHVRVDKTGRVYRARAEGGDAVLQSAATEAATNSKFSPEKLRGRAAEGTITYTFKP